MTEIEHYKDPYNLYMRSENMPGKAKRNIRIGDEFDVPVRVTALKPSGLDIKPYKIEVRGRPDLFDWVCGATLEASRLVKAAPEPLKVDDRVIVGHYYGKILALTKTQVWVHINELDKAITYDLGAVKRAE
jgi:hypothetical protein